MSYEEEAMFADDTGGRLPEPFTLPEPERNDAELENYPEDADEGIG